VNPEPTSTGVAGEVAAAVRVDPVAVCQAVSRTFGRGGVEVAALRAVSCRVEPGMGVAVTGPSGSGKSTLLHVLAGLDRPTGGSVTWPGLGGGPGDRPTDVGVVFQGPSLVSALDVAENVTLPLLLHGCGEDEAVRRAHAALERVQVGELSTKLPEELSGGQAQRVAVARVLAARPRLILADEPTGQLDHATAERVVSVLLDTAAELGAALVISTHDDRVARRLPCRWHMDDGRLTTADAPSEDML
jgi:ABC-type lipoprotein export system ATPase subunit